MARAVFIVTIFMASLVAGVVRAQTAWVQIEAQPSLGEAEERARAYAGVFPNVNGFSLSSGWYAIALGPYSDDEAVRQLVLLTGERMIPGDSYVVDGSRFRGQFWPVGAALGTSGPAPAIAEPAPDPAPQAEALLQALPEESPREARQSEALMTGEDRELIQTALAWFGHYTAAIDGDFGPGTRKSMASWQGAMGMEPTGILTTNQRRQLTDSYRADLAALGLELYRDDSAGIEVMIPGAMVAFDRYEAPFVHFAEKDGSGVRVLLISQQGDQETLYGLYDILQTLEIMPLEGARERKADAFTMSGRNDKVQSYAQAEVQGGLIKGFILAWRPEDAARMGKVLDAMQASFKPYGDRALPDVIDSASSEAREGLMSGLEVRHPVLSRTGFYIDAEGMVLTTTEALSGCGRITLDGEVEADVVMTDAALGIGVLRPRQALAPAAHAAFQTFAPRANAEVAVAGYSYEGALTAPVMTFGTFAEGRGLAGEETLARLALTTLPGDAGGPVFDSSGAVLGMLLPRETQSGRVLPADVGFAADAGAITEALAAQGITLAQAQPGGAMAAEDLTGLALGMTVLVSCWD